MNNLQVVNKDDDKVFQPQPSPPRKLEENEPIASISQYYPQYLKYMNQNLEGQPILSNPSTQLQQLKLKISPMLTNRFENFNFKMREQSITQQVVILDVKYGYFQAVIKVLIQHRPSPAHNLNQFESQGTFATIYMAQLFGKKAAIKCHKYKQGTFQQVFTNVVCEYFLLFIASKLQAGPSINKQCGFDIIVYNHIKDSCIQFSMEQCLQLNKNSLQGYQLKRSQNQLKNALNTLHFFHIVHFDIKPQNICFSPTYNKQVFIDFGTSEIVYQNLGSKTYKQSFKGTIAYSGVQMLQVYYSRKPAMVDTYYNDVVSLQKSYQKIINSQKLQNHNYKNQLICDKTKDYLIILMKFYLLCEIAQSQNGYHLFKKYKSYFLSNHSKELYQLMRKRPYCVSTINIHKNIKLLRLSRFSKDKINYYINDYMSQRLLKNKSQHLKIRKQIASIYENFNRKDVVSTLTLTNIDAILKINQQIYFTNLAYNLQVDDMSCSFQEKIRISTIFMQKYIGTPTECSDHYLQKSIQYLFDYSFQGQLTTQKEEILQILIISIFVYQIKTQQEILDSFVTILSVTCNIQAKQKILFKYLTAIEWVKQKHKTNYNTQKMQFFMWTQTKKFLQNNKNNQQFILLKLLICTQLRQNSNQLLSINKWQMYKERVIFDPFITDVQIFLLYLSLHKNYKYAGFHKKEKLFIQVLIKQNEFYYKDKFSFIIFQLIKNFHNNHKSNQYKKFIELYKHMFQKFQFYKHFQVFIQEKLFQVSNLSQRPLSECIEQTIIILKQSQPLQLMKYQKIYLDMALFNPSQASLFLQLLKFDKIFLKESISQKIQTAHSYDFFDSGHKLNVQIRQHINHIQKYYLLVYKSTKNKESKQRTNQQFIIILEQFFQYCNLKINDIKCYKCKMLSLIELQRINLIKLFVSKNIQNAINICINLLTIIVKDKQLSKIRLQVVQSILKFGFRTSQQLLLIHQYFKLTSNLQLYLTIPFCQILSNVYLQLYRRGQLDQICKLIQVLSQLLQNSYQKQRVAIYIKFLLWLIYQVKQKKCSQQFFKANLQIIQNWKKAKNPYLSLYFSSILKIRSEPLQHNFIYLYIAQSLGKIDPISRKYVLNEYYSDYIRNFQPKSRRKYNYLNKMHNKHKQQLSSIGKFLMQLGQNITNNRRLVKDNIKYLTFQKNIIRYHQNIGNLPE